MELDFQIGFEVFGAGAFVVQRNDADGAASMPRAGALKVGRNVGRAADVPVVTRNAVANPHAPIASDVYYQNLVVSDARSVERLPLAVLSSFYTAIGTSPHAAKYAVYSEIPYC